MTRIRLNHMPGVVAWLKLLRDEGPQRRLPGRAGASARRHGLTDYWVRYEPTGQWLFLKAARALDGRPDYYKRIDYGPGLEALTDKGRQVLDDFLT
jgi:hypothetical protein